MHSLTETPADDEAETMHEATRTRISFSGEVLTAAAFLAATVLVGALIVRELRVMPRAFPAASAQATAASVSVPAEAVSVPALTLGTHELRVGDSLAVALTRLDGAVTLVRKVAETGPLGPREIRSYDLAGTRFILVAEPFERGGALRLSAIYLQ